MTGGERIFMDTNVLLAATDTKRAGHLSAQKIFSLWPEEGIDLFASGQVIREYLVVATRPIQNNGLGLGNNEALENVQSFRARLTLCAETAEVCSLLQRFGRELGTSGKEFHDLNIAATALSAGIRKIVTANARDFPAEIGIEVISLDSLSL